MRYLAASLYAGGVGLGVAMALGILIGQAVDGLEGRWQIVPIVGVWGTSVGIAALAFRSALRRDRPRAVVANAEASRGVADDGLMPEARFVVRVDEQRVVCRRPSGEEEMVRWEELEAVIIETNDSGPWGADVWWVLIGRGGSSGCAIPQGATGEDALLAALQELEGFDNERVIEAMSSTDNRRFECWRRAKAHGTPE